MNPELHAKIKIILDKEFNNIIEQCRPGTLESEKASIVACMALAARLGIELWYALDKETTKNESGT